MKTLLMNLVCLVMLASISSAFAQKKYSPPKPPAADETCYSKDAKWVRCDTLPETDAMRMSRAVEQDRLREESAKKKACGRDFMALRVGMRLDRFEQCHEALSYMTETVSSAGPVETYRSTFYIIHASKGVITGYTRRLR